MIRSLNDDYGPGKLVIFAAHDIDAYRTGT